LSFLGFAVVEVRTYILQGLTASTTNFNLQLRAGHRKARAAINALSTAILGWGMAILLC
jgi:hypothetical protein